jgi:hypothetical protein
MVEKADLLHDASESWGTEGFEIELLLIELLLYESTQEVRDENFDNRSIRSVVCCRHVPLSSHGESGLHQLHNFTNPE